MLVGLFALLQALAGPGDTVVVTDRVTCTTCRLDTRTRIAVGSSLDSASLSAGGLHQIGRTLAGETVVLHRMSSDGAVLVYDSSGNLLRSIGRKGSGPGEIRSAWSMTLIEPDTVVVFDDGLRRMTWFTTAGTYVRSKQIPLAPHDAVRLRDGTFVLMAESRTAERAGLLLHHVAADGRIIRSFHDYVALGGGIQLVLPFFLTPLPDGGFMVFDRRNITFTWYDARARPTSVVRREAAWVKQRVPTETRPGEGECQPTPVRVPLAPFPMFRSVHVDPRGLVWLIGAVERPGWRAGGDPFDFSAAFLPARLQHFWTGIVDVIDPASGRLVFHGRLPFVADQLRDGLLARPTEDADGSLRIELHEVTLRGLPSTSR